MRTLVVTQPSLLGLPVEERYRKVADGLSRNKFHFLLHRIKDEARIKDTIASTLALNGQSVTLNQLERDVKFVNEFFKGSKRMDETVLAYIHPLCVGMDAAMIGYSYKYVQKGFVHDCIEDAEKLGHGANRIKERLRARFSAEVRDDTVILSRGKAEEFAAYLARIFNFNKVGVFMLKFLDNLENLKGLYFDGCPESLINSTIEKSLQYVYILKKINKELFELMLGLIKGIAPERFLPAITDIEEKSMRQAYREHRGYVVLNPRENINLSLLQSLPYAGSPVVTVYLAEGHTLDSLEEKKWDAPEYVEVELPDFVGNVDAARKLLDTHFSSIEFERVKSRLTPLVACTNIFRADKPVNGELKRFFKSLNRLGKDIGDIYGHKITRMSAMASQIVNFVREL